MPTLDWIGKKTLVNHQREVPYRLVHCDAALSAGALPMHSRQTARTLGIGNPAVTGEEFVIASTVCRPFIRTEILGGTSS